MTSPSPRTQTSNSMYGVRPPSNVSSASRVTYDEALVRMRQLNGSPAPGGAGGKRSVAKVDPLIALTQQMANQKKPGTPCKHGRRSVSARGAPSAGGTSFKQVGDRSDEIIQRLQARMAAIGAQLGDPEPEPEPQQPASARQAVRQPSAQKRRSSVQSQSGAPRDAAAAASAAAADAALSTAAATHAAAEFIPAAKFSGPKVGYEFKSGPSGMGYYQMAFLKQIGPGPVPQPVAAAARAPSSARISLGSQSARSVSRPGTGMSTSSLDSEWVFALNDAARNCEIRQQSRMSHRGGNVMTWAEPLNLSPIGEAAWDRKASPERLLLVSGTPSKMEMPLGQPGEKPWEPRAPWNETPKSGSTPRHGRRVFQPQTSGAGGPQAGQLGAAGVVRPPPTPGYGKNGLP